jgi:2,3-bisphosphoglycerate-dependent phosphoglycerate mutase
VAILTKTIVYLLRHAQSSPDQEIAESEWPLSQSGTEQASALIEPLNEFEIDRIFTSPFSRTIATISPYCSSNDLAFEINEDLRERKLKEPSMVENWQDLIEKAWKDFDFALPNCESGYSCQSRMSNCISALVSAHPGKTLLMSSHGNAISLYLNKLDSTFGYTGWQSMKNPDLFRIIFNGDSPRWDKTVLLQRSDI